MWAMARLERIGRRTWLGRVGGGFLAAWTGLSWERGRESWAGWLGWDPRTAAAQSRRRQTIPVEIELNFQGQTFPCAAFLVVRGTEVTIVDTLVEGNADRIGDMLRQAGLDWRGVRHVILTHYHFDHSGSADEIASRAPQATVWAGEADIPEIALSRPLAAAHDGDEIFGLRIVATPGHTAGHISVLDPVGSTLMTGDAIFNIGGDLGLPPAAFSADLTATLASIRKLGGLGFEQALFAHGTPIEQGAAAAFARLAAAGAALPDLSTLVDPHHNCLLHQGPHHTHHHS
jgi:glyoxylase-like metal-dependent hydrolase (beta-lactamase superfamily II)